MRTSVTLVGLLAAALSAPPPSVAASVRLFAVGHKQRLQDAATHETYRAKMSALMDAAHPERTQLVQGGVDDVASHLRPADAGAPQHALVVFPESVGLIAAFIGSRGDGARAQSLAAAAIVSLAGTYGPQVAHYQQKFPGQPAVRTLVTALTDTLYRSVYETFRDLAVAHGVYLAASADIAPARRVEAADEPALVALLRDPDEPGRPYAYEAVSPFPVNTTFLFAPDGTVLVPDGRGGTRRSPDETDGVLRGTTDKTYLTPLEQPPPGEAAGLSLGFGSVRDMEVLDTPVGRLAVVISKDAWMVDVNDRFEAKGATVYLQPEAFDSWAFSTDEWSPDVFKEGGFATVQRQPGTVANVTASMTGNLFEITFDGQSAVIGRRRKGPRPPLGSDNAFVGQNPETAFLALGPWIVPDPGADDPTLPLQARRAALAGDGRLLLPGSAVACADTLAAGACGNGYREAVVWADVDLPEPGGPGPIDPTRAAPPAFATNGRVNPPEAIPVAQQAPRLATRGTRVFVVWHEHAAGQLPSVHLAVSRDGGRTFAPPVKVSDQPAGAVAELHPGIAVRGRTLLVVWQTFDDGWDDDTGRIMSARFDVRGRKRGADLPVDDGVASGKWLPQVVFAAGRPVVAWIDERDRGPEGEVLEHVYVARGVDRRGSRFDTPRRVDAGEPVALAAHLDNKWHPALAARGRRVHLAWVDFRDYNWDVITAASTDGGETFGANVRIDDFAGFERINERPALALDRDGTVHAAWTDLRARQPDTNVFHAHSIDGGSTFTPNVRLDDADVALDLNRAAPSNQWHPSLVADRGWLAAVWQDDRAGNNDVWFATRGAADAAFGPAERVDDTGDGPSAQTRPQLTIAGRGRRRRCHAVWVDDRDGSPDIYHARRACGP